jgi:small-conductance mechanosensitive channel
VGESRQNHHSEPNTDGSEKCDSATVLTYDDPEGARALTGGMAGISETDRFHGFARWFEGLTGAEAGMLAPLLDTLIIALGYLLLRRMLRLTLVKHVDEPARRYTIGKVLGYGLATVAILLCVQIWTAGTVDLSTYLGILSAGLAIALKDPIVSVAAWLWILVRQPFKVGDRIQVGDVAGDIVDIGPLTFSMLEIGNWVHDDQSTGRIIHLPNASVFRDYIASYTHGFEFIWNELRVVVTFESDWSRARDVLTEVAWQYSEQAVDEVEQQLEQTARKYMVSYNKLTPIVWVAVVDIGVALDVRYLCRARARRTTATNMWSAILDRFGDETEVDFAYPTQRFFDNNSEGKLDLRASETAKPELSTVKRSA